MATLKRQFGLSEWAIHFEFGKCSNEEWGASCSADVDYRQALLTFDLTMHGSESDLLNSLRHEMLHIVVAPMDLHRDLMMQGIKPGSEKWRIESRMFTFSVEQTIGNLERFCDRVGVK